MFVPINYFIFMLWFIKIASGNSLKPTILNEVPKNCKYKIAQQLVDFWSKLDIISNGHFTIYMNLCENIPKEYCGKNVKLCIRDERQNFIVITGDQFSSGETANLLLVSPKTAKCDKKDTSAKVTIKFICSVDVKEPRLLVVDDCEFEVHLLKPNCSELFCGVWVYYRWLDLTPLQNDYLLSSENEYNLSVAICSPKGKQNHICKKDGVTSCDIRKGLMPISIQDREIIEYLPNENEIRIYNSHREVGFSKNVVFKITLKCDWTKLSPELYYMKPKTQGRFYTFEMKTSLGCIKIPPSCEFRDRNLNYNLTSLNKVSHVEVDQQTQILLNICGPLFGNENMNDCSRNFSQVCEVTNQNKFINRGSIQQGFYISSDGTISTSFINGAPCEKDHSMQYQTRIDISCGMPSKIKLVSSDNCETHLKWISPTACPKYQTGETPNCDYMTHADNNCTFEVENYFYNLSNLSKKDNKYIIKEKENNSIDYRLNICGSVMENPCKKDVMVAITYLDEIDIRKREISLGKLNKDKVYRENNTLVIETSGELCIKELFKLQYYRSLIYFECSEIEEKPKLLRKSNCTFEFIWKTPVSCPKNLNEIEKQCVYKNLKDQKEINFNHLKRTFLNVTISGFIYIFDLCDNNPRCLNKETCLHVPANNLTYVNKTFLEFTLNRPCISLEHFNKTQFHLVCDPITNNDHFVFKSLEDCTIKFELKTSLVCSRSELVVTVKDERVKQITHKEYIMSNNDKRSNNSRKMSNFNKEVGLGDVRDTRAKENVNKLVVTTDISNVHPNVNCSIVNQYTGYQFNISNLNLSISSYQCPSYSFGYENKLTDLTYSTNRACHTNSGKLTNVTFVISLKCSEGNTQYTNPVNTSCEKYLILEKPEFCKLLEISASNQGSLSAGSETGIIMGVIAGIFLIIGSSWLGYIGFKRRKSRFYNNIDYVKDGDL